MNLPCPVCRAKNPTGPACRRCRSDLSLLVAVEARREFHLSRAQSAIGARQFETARNELTLAEQLRTGPDIHRLRACLFLLSGDFSGAFTEHAAVTG